MFEIINKIIDLIKDKKKRLIVILVLASFVVGFTLKGLITIDPIKLEAQKRVNELVSEISNMGNANTNGFYFVNDKAYKILQSKLDELVIQSKIADQYEQWEHFIEVRRAKKEPTLKID
jgi:hypothetical protein